MFGRALVKWKVYEVMSCLGLRRPRCAVMRLGIPVRWFFSRGLTTMVGTLWCLSLRHKHLVPAPCGPTLVVRR